ncbi:MAG TPA: RIP metalloprotease RseP [Verrucomicrobiae bacterium]|nr:RIP metalloprotease RseP [Verrucomicrobiae bacterium]
MNIIYVVLAVMLAFGASIFVHELGHFWVARKLGMKVDEFAVGFGPKIFGWKRDGVKYTLRGIPAGGYVALPQMITAEALEGKSEEQVPSAPPSHKILVALAGPFMNIVFAFAIAILIYFVGLPIAVNPAVIGYVAPNSAEAKLGIHEGDRIISVDGAKVKSWQDVMLHTIVARTNVVPVAIEHDGAEQTYQLQTMTDNAVGLKLLNLDPRDHPQVMEVMSGSAAEKGGLKQNDKIISFAGVPIASRDQFIDLIRKRGGQTNEVQVERDGKKMTLAVTPTIDPTTKIGRIGVMLGTDSTQVYIVQKPGPSPLEQVRDVFDKTFETLGALVHSKETGVGAKDLSGPIGIFSMLASQVNTDYRLALSFLVLLNINLAIINLLPIPVLDGGHILMAVIEKIRRRPLHIKLVERVTTCFVVLLLSFYVYVTFFDIKRIPLFRAMFKGDVQIQQAAQPEDSAPVKSK